MDSREKSIDIDKMLRGSINEAWDRCVGMRRERGRVEDKPRNLHVPRYRVTPEKWLGYAFAETFLDDWRFVRDKLSSVEPVESACAHDILNYMLRHWENVPAEVYAIPLPLPAWVQQELADLPNRYATFRGRTLGELFRFEQQGS